MALSGERKVKDKTLIRKKFEGHLEELEGTCFGCICMGQMSSLEVMGRAFPWLRQRQLGFCSLPAAGLFSHPTSNMGMSCPVGHVVLVKASSVVRRTLAPASQQKSLWRERKSRLLRQFDLLLCSPSALHRSSPASSPPPPTCRPLLAILDGQKSPVGTRLEKIDAEEEERQLDSSTVACSFLACQFTSEPWFRLTRWHT